MQRRGGWHVHQEYATVKKSVVFSLARNVESELALQMSFGSEFQTFGAATQNARLAVSVRVLGTERRRASAHRRDRVVTWRHLDTRGPDVERLEYVDQDQPSPTRYR